MSKFDGFIAAGSSRENTLAKPVPVVMSTKRRGRGWPCESAGIGTSTRSVDALLLVKSRYALGQNLDWSQKRAVRNAFFDALVARLKETTEKTS